MEKIYENSIKFHFLQKIGERDQIKRSGKPTTLRNSTHLHIGAIKWWNRKPPPVPEIRLGGKEEPSRHESCLYAVS
jgi:hypothetical protein